MPFCADRARRSAFARHVPEPLELLAEPEPAGALGFERLDQLPERDHALVEKNSAQPQCRRPGIEIAAACIA